MEDALLQNGTQELLYQLVALIISGLMTVLSVYLKKFLQTNKYAVEYNLYNEKTERVLENAVMYAEEKAKSYAKGQVKKRDLAVKYIDSISPDIIAKEGKKLEFMLDRKVSQLVKQRKDVTNTTTEG